MGPMTSCSECNHTAAHAAHPFRVRHTSVHRLATPLLAPPQTAHVEEATEAAICAMSTDKAEATAQAESEAKGLREEAAALARLRSQAEVEQQRLLDSLAATQLRARAQQLSSDEALESMEAALEHAHADVLSEVEGRGEADVVEMREQAGYEEERVAAAMRRLEADEGEAVRSLERQLAEGVQRLARAEELAAWLRCENTMLGESRGGCEREPSRMGGCGTRNAACGCGSASV